MIIKRSRIVKKIEERKQIFILMSVVAFLLILSNVNNITHAATKVSEICIGCHENVKALIGKSVTHEPAIKGQCGACHNPHVSRYKGLLSDSAGRLCYSCHDKTKGFTAKVVHKPVADGNCLGCHDAHSSENKALLTMEGEKVCFTCHPREKILTGEYAHPEVKKGNCAACHNPHSSDKNGLLAADRKSLCANCHYKASASAKPCFYKVEGSDCLSCHSPHSSAKPGILKATIHKPLSEKKCAACHGSDYKTLTKTGSALCEECHKKTMKSFNKLNNHLIPGLADNPCSNCHDPHASDEKHLFKDKQERICFDCHEDTRLFVAGQKHAHPTLPDCTGCHVSHGSDNALFLTAGENTCSIPDCHPTQGSFTHPIGPEIIDPRSGQPMTCMTCHNPMGSPEKFILILEKDRELCIQCHQV